VRTEAGSDVVGLASGQPPAASLARTGDIGIERLAVRDVDDRLPDRLARVGVAGAFQLPADLGHLGVGQLAGQQREQRM